MIKDIAHVCLLAEKLEDAEHFYCEGLGFRKVFNFIRDGKIVGCYLQVTESRFVEIFERSDAKYFENQSLQHMCFEVENIDVVCSHLKALGIHITEKTLGADKSWQAWTADPSGVKIEFHQYTPKSSQCTGADCVFT